jgi:2-oxoglutarate dehydrogenase E2 component (dihydrolipoamide succinyltransferase)
MAEEIKVPSLGESITEATIGTWMKQVGDAVHEDEPIVELETDKVAMEVPSPVSGVITEILAAEGNTVEVDAIIAKVDISATAAPRPQKAATAPAAAAATQQPAPEVATEAPAQATAPSQELKAMSPAVRKLVEEYALNPATITGTGKDGRLTKGDVQKAIDAGTATPQAPSVPAAPTGVAQAKREERVPMSRLRKVIAKRLKDAQNTAAMLTTYNEVDMTAVMATRKQYKELFEKKHNARLGFMSFFTKACIMALKEIPAVNGEIENDEIVYKNYYNIGVAVSSPSGLVVPVIKDADQLSFADLENAIFNYGMKSRDGKITLDDMQGGTFTISNGGVFGSLLSSPILNPPQSGILGMHKIQQRPVAIDGQVVIRPMMYLALSYDHRIIDGREAVTFLVRVKECLEDPNRMLLDL